MLEYDIDDVRVFRLKYGNIKAFFASKNLNAKISIKMTNNNDTLSENVRIIIKSNEMHDIFRAAKLLQTNIFNWFGSLKRTKTTKDRSYKTITNLIKSNKVDINACSPSITKISKLKVTPLMIACGHRGYTTKGS